MPVIAGIDVECTGLNPEVDRVIEIAYVVYDTSEGIVFPKETISSLVYEEGYPEITAEIEEITGISQAMLDSKFAKTPKEIFTQIADSIGKHSVCALMAHNASFDKSFLDMEMKRLGLTGSLPWICTMNDIEHPKKFKCKKLSHLAFEYGVEFDNKSLHRADADVNLMFDMCIAAGVDFDHLFARSLIPTVTVRAIIPSPFGPNGDGGVGKDKAASLGYRWQGDKKIWTKNIKEDQFGIEEEKLGYKIAIV